VPIHPELLPTLERLIGDREDGFVFAGLVTTIKTGDRSNGVRKRFARLKTKLGHGDRHVYHSIRKTVGTLLENAGVLENIAADILGHETQRITYKIYSGGASLEVKRDALARLSYPTRAP
jgi:integrase